MLLILHMYMYSIIEIVACKLYIVKLIGIFDFHILYTKNGTIHSNNIVSAIEDIFENRSQYNL